METKNILEALKKLREEGKKRNFKQSVDFSILLKEVDLNSPDSKIEEYVTLAAKLPKETKVCALVDKELVTAARGVCDKVISKDEFDQYTGNKKAIRKLANEFDFFIAQATIMVNIAATFGKVFGPKGKMPNPRHGCVIPPKFDIAILVKRLKNTAVVQNKKQPVVSVRVGEESMSDEDIAKNVMVVYEAVKKKLPRGDQQIKKSYVKMTMSKPVLIGA